MEFSSINGPSRISPFMVPKLMVNAASAQVAIRFGLKGPQLCIGNGVYHRVNAIGEAVRIIQRGDADIMIAGSSEAVISPLGLAGFSAMKALSTRNDAPQKASRPFDKDRDGFVISEGAGVIVVEELEIARKRGQISMQRYWGTDSMVMHIILQRQNQMVMVQCDV